MIVSAILLFFLLVTPLWGASELPPLVFTDSFVIGKSPQVVTINVGGNLDETRFLWPNMPAKKRFLSRIKISNEGNQNVINPRLRINGFRVPLNSNELIRSITHGSHDPLDQVLRTFYTMCDYRIHAAPSIDARKPLSFFLYHSHGICDDQTSVQAELWQLYGYKWRSSGPYNHASAEVEVLGKSIHLDTDLMAYYLMYDNKTIASAQDIHDDPMLVLRATHNRVYHRFPRLPYEPEVDMYFSSEKYAALYGPGALIEPFVLNEAERTSVRIDLRPGESYGWHTGERKVVNPFNNDPYIPTVARDVLWETHLNLKNMAHLWFLSGTTEKTQAQKRGIVDLKKTLISIPYRLPFPVLGMKIRLISNLTGNSGESGDSDKICIRISTTKKMLQDCVALKDILKDEYSLDHLVKEMSYPLREFRIEIDGRNLFLNKHEEVSFSGIQVNLNCLSTIFALRGLRAGENILSYSDASSIRSVRITTEADGEFIKLPSFGGDRFYPSANAKVPEVDLEFTWMAAFDASIAGYHFQVSSFPDMRYPLSPTFDRLVTEDQIRIIGRTVVYRLPWYGMLPVQKKLYWRVRPYNKDLIAGEWSKPASFEVRGPGAPEQIKLTEQDGKIVLNWKAAPYGSSPAYYEIHTSNLEGFIPVNRPHRLLGLSDGNTNKRCWHDACATAWPVVPSTFFASTRANSIVVMPSDRKNLKKRPGAHWRVIAVDAKGSRSCPSPQAFLRTPLLLLPETAVLPPGKVTYRVPVISTLGRIYVTGNYDMGLWFKPQLAFSLPPNSPQNWKIDRTRGLITGALKDNEEVSLQVSVHDQFGRKDARVLKVRTGGR